MKLYESNLWMNDIDMVLSHLPELRDLNNKNVMITGASGLICSAVADILIRFNENCNGRIQIYAVGRNQQKMKSRFAEFYGRDYFHYLPYDSYHLKNIFDFHCDFIIHGAGNSSPKKIIREPVETMVVNIFGIKDLLDFAMRSRSKRVLYISSSEVYGRSELVGSAKENDYGFIDNLIPRNSYSIGKKAAETLCISYAAEYGIDSVITRPGHIYGPTAGISDDHVSSSWAYDAAYGKNIIMKSNGVQVRSYVYCLDCASAILKVLLCGEKGKAYNISNPNSIISIKQMAEILCKVGNVKLQIGTINLEDRKRLNPMTNSALDSSALLELGWKGCFNAEIGFMHTVEILKELLC